MKYKLVLAVVAATLLAPAAFAGGGVDVSGLIQPGLYEVIAQMTVQDVGAMPSRTQTTCVTQAQVKDFAGYLADQLKRSNATVQVTDPSLHGKDLHLAFTTPQGNMSVDTVFDDPTHYHQTLSGMMAGHKVSWQTRAHRVGDCEKPSK